MTPSLRPRATLVAGLASLLVLSGCGAIQEARATPPDPDNPSDMALLQSGKPGSARGFVEPGTEDEDRFIGIPRRSLDELDERVSEWCQEHGIEIEPAQECLLEYWTPDALRLSPKTVWNYWADNEVMIRCTGIVGSIPNCHTAEGQAIPRLPGDDDPWWDEQAVSDPGRPGLRERPETRANLPDPQRKMMTTPSYDEWPDGRTS